MLGLWQYVVSSLTKHSFLATVPSPGVNSPAATVLVNMSTSEFHRVRVRSFICLFNTSILDIWSISDCQLWLQIGNLFTDNLGLFMVQTSEPNLLQLIRQCVEINY